VWSNAIFWNFPPVTGTAFVPLPWVCLGATWEIYCRMWLDRRALARRLDSSNGGEKVKRHAHMHANMHTKFKCICTDVHVYFCTQSHHDGRAKGDQIRERKRERKRERERERERERAQQPK